MLLVIMVIIYFIWKNYHYFGKFDVVVNITPTEDQYSNDGQIDLQLNGNVPYEIKFNQQLYLANTNHYRLENVALGEYKLEITDKLGNVITKLIKMEPGKINKSPFFWDQKCLLNENKTKYYAEYVCKSVKGNKYIEVDDDFCIKNNLNKPKPSCPIAPYQIRKSIKIENVKAGNKIKIGLINKNKVEWLTLDDKVFQLSSLSRKLLYLDGVKSDGNVFSLNKISDNQYTLEEYFTKPEFYEEESYSLKSRDFEKNVFDGYESEGRLFMTHHQDGEIQPLNTILIIPNGQFYFIKLNGMFMKKNDDLSLGLTKNINDAGTFLFKNYFTS